MRSSKRVFLFFVFMLLINISPEVGFDIPDINFASVDFPEPFFPIILTNSPFIYF